MDDILNPVDWLIGEAGRWGAAVASLTAIALLIQLYYLLVVFARIPAFRNPKLSSYDEETGRKDRNGGMSLIVVVRNADYAYLEETLPKLMTQDYEHFEVVFVNLSDNEDFTESLSALSEHNPRIAMSTIPSDPRFSVSNKMALNIGIKAARYENILFSTTDAAPVSDKWLSLMARGFEAGDVVIGYCGVEPAAGMPNKFMRMDQLAVSSRWLSRAMKGRAYAATLSNMGFTKSLYFANNGFNRLNMNIGEDSLFISKIARRDNTAVVASPNSVVRRQAWGDMKWWMAERRFQSYVYRYYGSGVKFYIGCELWSRGVFFLGTAAMVFFMPYYFPVFAGLLALRFFIALFETGRICRRLNEHKLMAVLPLYDLAAPFYEAMLMIGRRIKPSKGIWKQ